MTLVNTTRPRATARMQIKVYLVCQWLNLAQAGEMNTRIIGAFLTRRDAEVLQEATPGTFIDKQVATKG